MSELVERTGAAAATIRYYLVEGLLPPPVKVAANRYLYDERHVEAVRLVRLLRERRGLSLDAIGRLLPDLLPDLLGKPDEGVFRPEMWRQILEPGGEGHAGPPIGVRILIAGLDAFCRHGYAEVTIDDVCRAADVAKGTFYRNFASKEELFFAAAQETGRRISEQFLATADAVGSADGPPDLAAAAEWLVVALSPHLPVVLDLASLAVQRRPGHGRALRAFLNQVRSAVDSRFGGLEGDFAEGLFEHVLGEAIRRGIDEFGGGADGALGDLPGASLTAPEASARIGREAH